MREHRQEGHAGNGLLQQFQPLPAQLRRHEGQSRDVPTWPGKVGHEPAPDWISDWAEHNGNRARRSLRSESRRRCLREEQVDLEADEVGGEV